MDLVFHNSATRRKETFVPGDPAHVTIYVCGPTVYDFAHIGNARPSVVFDVLVRLLRRRFAQVTYVRNVTDVDDKINAAAKANGESIRALTERTLDAYLADMRALGVLDPDHQPRVTEHMGEIIALCLALIERGHAYEAEGHVLFAVESFAAYGKLSGRAPDELLAGARIDVAPYKRNPGDFVLWKPSPDDLPGWESPWGRGRPGWHIECSAMIEKQFGPTIDIHGGGNDLIFPHHENELAQSCCAHGGAPLARYWLHNGMLLVNGEKMSKSLGNFFTVRDLLAKVPGEALRLHLLRTHYRSPLDLTESGLAETMTILDRLYAAVDPGQAALPAPEVEAALADDLNTPLALTRLQALAKAAREGSTEAAGQLLGGGALLGLRLEAPELWAAAKARLAPQVAALEIDGTAYPLDDAGIETLLELRRAARAAKNFARSDEIRDKLTAAGIQIMDSKDGTRWSRV